MRKLLPALLALLFLETLFFLSVQTAGIRVTVCRVRDARLADMLGGVRVVQVSDLHIRRIGPRERKLIAMIERLDPDVIFVTGDFVSGIGGIPPCAELFRKITPHRTVIGVLGNNDHPHLKGRMDTARLVAVLRKAGVHMLVNRSLKLTVRTHGGARPRSVYVTGLDDNFLWYDDLFAAVRNVPRGAPRILLAHAPNIIEKIETKDIPLILSGHTHGGQIVIPFIGALYVNPPFRSAKRFVSGLYRDDTLLYVNRGIGTVLLPVRLFCRPEITVFEFAGPAG